MAQRESTTRSAVQAMVGLVETRTDGTCAAACVVARSQIFFRALRFILHYRSLSLLTPPPQMHSLSLSFYPLAFTATCHELAVLEKLAGAASSEYDQIEKQTTGIAAFDEDLSHRGTLLLNCCVSLVADCVCIRLTSALCSLLSDPPPIHTHTHIRTPCTARDCSHLFTEIDELDANIDKLESVVEQLSEYSIHLEKRLQTATSAP